MGGGEGLLLDCSLLCRPSSRVSCLCRFEALEKQLPFICTASVKQNSIKRCAAPAAMDVVAVIHGWDMDLGLLAVTSMNLPWSRPNGLDILQELFPNDQAAAFSTV